MQRRVLLSPSVEVVEDASCWLLEMMPPELLCVVLDMLLRRQDSESVRNLAAWCLTCSTFNDMCDDERRYRCRCFAASPVLFGLKLSPLFGGPLRAPSPPPSSSCAGESSLSSSTRAQGPLTWKLRAQLLDRLPKRLLPKGTTMKGIFTLRDCANPDLLHKKVEVVDSDTGRVHTNVTGDIENLITDLPFLNTNLKGLTDALALLYPVASESGDGDLLKDGADIGTFFDKRRASHEPAEPQDSGKRPKASDDDWLDDDDEYNDMSLTDDVVDEHALSPAERRRLESARAVLFQGVDYFEVEVVRNTQATNRACGVALSQEFNAISYIGWTNNSIAYHSDDGTVRRSGSGFQRWKHPFSPFTTGDVIGCGVDWDASEVFFVRVAAAPYESSPQGIDIFIKKQDMAPRPWYPAIGSVAMHDVMKLNTGQEPFVFDIRAFVEKKRAGDLSTFPNVQVFDLTDRGLSA